METMVFFEETDSQKEQSRGPEKKAASGKTELLNSLDEIWLSLLKLACIYFHNTKVPEVLKQQVHK